MSDSEENFNYISSETTTGISMWTSYVFPGKPHNPKGCHQIWIKGLLPDVNAEDATLRFRAPQQSLELYLDGVRIYSFGTIDTSNTQRTPGSIWHLVTLPSGWQGKELYFRTYAPVEEYSGYMIDLEIGSKSTHVLNIISENMPSFVIGIALILLGMLLIFIVFAGILQQKGIISLGLFSILIGIWYIAERKIPQLFIASPLLLIYIANVSIFLMPAAFLSFTRNILASDSTLEGRVLKRLSQFFYPFTAIMLLLDLSGTYSCLRTVLFLHVMLVISALIVILIILKAALNKNRYAWIFLVGVLFFAIANLYDAYNLFYSEAQNAHPITIGHWGTLMFILSLASITGLQMKTLINQLKINSQENEINYKSLFNNMSEGFLHTRVIMDKDNQPEDYMVMEANPSLLSNLGLPKESVIGRLVGDILPEIG
ncbi:MAG: 7TM-DISM domain-containing protein, partial [Clostridiales bacterium]|nr:7TM-DISM domain-containing protein [Clostridiales bacterium]